MVSWGKGAQTSSGTVTAMFGLPVCAHFNCPRTWVAIHGCFELSVECTKLAGCLANCQTFGGSSTRLVVYSPWNLPGCGLRREGMGPWGKFVDTFRRVWESEEFGDIVLCLRRQIRCLGQQTAT